VEKVAQRERQRQVREANRVLGRGEFSGRERSLERGFSLSR
jgi:hypothetical protein